ncbi:MAG: phosphoribosylaminoimidazolesuccinocarboxamide synthase [Nitrospirota bacterium]|nr:phosphoribosylaminoimidazolesuccinocarboxamide synthase [Nitrospirota bacterium]MDH5768348.1 phosphoribosylaminoimidazolesuccinocarboxamide synthase [Nitrospirota bacterium]
MNKIILKTEFPDVPFVKSGKVRDIYDLGEYLLLVATDRISAFDVVLPNGIPGKGRVLTQISIFWFKQVEDIIPNHIIATKVEDFPEKLHKYADILDGRSMLVKKTQPMPVECVVRGYLSGSGWKEYEKSGTICGIGLPEGLVESSRLNEPLFTPSTKAEEGHDINITFDEVLKEVGQEMAKRLKDISIKVYSKARDIAEKKGIIIADTKFEFGLFNGNPILIDELLTPDSSRFWSIKDYTPGRSQDSYDKQVVRDYLLTLDWNHTYPGPVLPDEIIEKTAARYQEILKILTS